MANQATMMILTSNEDLIRQVSLNKTQDTHFLKLNSLTDLPEYNQSKVPPKKSNDHKCTICGDHATGFNYDVLSCASCKIFFRRNVHQKEKLRCLSGQRQCLVSYGIRRRCPRCRLERCFSMGMRKDFLLSEERKQQRKKHVQENRKLPINMNEDGDINVNSNQVNYVTIEILSGDDSIVIQSLRSSFLSTFQDHDIYCACIDVSDSMSALIFWSQFVSQIALQFISFFRQIPQFEGLDADDRFILIKYNVFSLFLISKCFYYKQEHDCCSQDDNELSRRQRRFFMLCGDTHGIRDAFVDMIRLLVKITEQDPILLSLLSIILLFTQGLSMNENEPTLKDSLAVNRVQCYYTTLLWNYLVSKQDEIQACKQFSHLVTLIIRVQVVGKTIRDFFCVKMMTSDVLHRLAPLIQTLLHIS